MAVDCRIPPARGQRGAGLGAGRERSPPFDRAIDLPPHPRGGAVTVALALLLAIPWVLAPVVVLFRARHSRSLDEWSDVVPPGRGRAVSGGSARWARAGGTAAAADVRTTPIAASRKLTDRMNGFLVGGQGQALPRSCR